ncbi:MAG TPA: efflux RND transporter permease subunit [Chloroflexota bacterium]|nr:efflux RND transporter permease subunit [Chloroflexota bacterium]
MGLTNVAIRRPLFMLMVIGALLVVGLVSWTKLGVDLLPALDFPIVVVTTVYPGASPEAVDTLITKRVEDAVVTINDIDYISSNSTEGVSSVVIFFKDNAPKDASIDVERKVSGIRGQLPTDAKDPSVGKYDPNAQPILQLTVSGKRDLAALQRLAEDKIQKQLEGTNGVAQVSVLGGLVREIQVQVDQSKLQARGLSILQVNQALAGDNVNVPAGSITQLGKDWNVRLDNQAQTPDELNNILVSSTSTGPVYLRDVATVVDAYKKTTNIQRTNGQSALGVTIIKQSSANTVETADNVKATIAQLKPDLPADVSISVASDASVFTRHSLDDVQHELAQAVLLTGLVLLVFLHTFRSTLIVLLTIPTSLIATLGVMYFLGLSLNMMSLMGLTLTVGILVDDSIVVLENIFRHLQLGEAPREAALNGRSEIGFAAIAITLVDVVVFAPIAFMSGITGQYFRQFGLVIISATLFSLFVSFTLTPLLASRWYRVGEHGEDKIDRPTRNPWVLFGRAWDRGYARIAAGYRRVLKFAIGPRARWVIVALGLLSFVGGIMLVTTGILSTEFFPAADDGEFQINLEMPPGTTLDVTNAATQTIEQRLMTWPEIDQVFTSVGVNRSGGFGTGGGRFATISVELIPKKDRVRTPTDLSQAARSLGADIPGAKVSAAPTGGIGGGGGAGVQVRIQGEDSSILAGLAAQVADVVKKVPGTTDINDGGVTGDPELVVSIDRRQAADLGLTPAQVGSVLRTGLAGSTVSTYRPEGTSGWDINVILNPDERQRVEQVGEIPIVAPNGTTVRLGQIANVTTVSGPTQIGRRDRQRSVYVSANLNGRPAGDVSRDIQVGLDQIVAPSGYKVTQGGEAQSQAESFGQIFAALGLSMLLMYMLMVALFESLVYPLMIMFSLPLAVVGAFGLLALTGNSLNMLSMIGLILLTGLVGKNAILLVDFTNTLRKRGLGRNEALLQAGPTRLRPIIMTTSAIVLAMSPIALKLGEGSEWRAPMAVTVIGGLLTSTLLTLVLIPAVYTIMDDLSGAVSRTPRLVRILARVPRVPRWRPQPHVPEAEAPRAPDRVPVPVGGGAE